ncbi:hypothetical protein DY000_02016945 [Brassica cretica]|uniref:SHSP domain-containing protein n=1 Tax=Brassica cretica TaxID=69181 RepID=A0ABQ7D5T9_BRACR|nr:hypothetical protein DY000_02016945 [Brassica cretica]
MRHDSNIISLGFKKLEIQEIHIIFGLTFTAWNHSCGSQPQKCMALPGDSRLRITAARGDGEMMMMAPPYENKEEETRRGEEDGALMKNLQHSQKHIYPESSTKSQREHSNGYLRPLGNFFVKEVADVNHESEGTMGNICKVEIE